MFPDKKGLVVYSQYFVRLVALLSKDYLHFQIQYTILFSLWLLSFEPEIAAILKYVKNYNILSAFLTLPIFQGISILFP